VSDTIRVVEIGHTRSSTRHRISRKRSRYVVESTSVIFKENAPKDSPLKDPRFVFLGPDEDGELLEVMAIENDSGGLLIIHAQRIRDRYMDLLKGGL
jgi:hypothetical protein